MSAETSAECPGLPKTALQASKRVLSGWLALSTLGTIFALPALLLIDIFYPTELPFAIISFSTVVFIGGVIRAKPTEEHEEAKELIQDLIEKYSFTLIFSIILVSYVIGLATILSMTVGISAFVSTYWHPIGGVIAAVLVPTIDHELGNVRNLLAPSGLARYLTLAVVVSLVSFHTTDTSELMNSMRQGGPLQLYP